MLNIVKLLDPQTGVIRRICTDAIVAFSADGNVVIITFGTKEVVVAPATHVKYVCPLSNHTVVEAVTG